MAKGGSCWEDLASTISRRSTTIHSVLADHAPLVSHRDRHLALDVMSPIAQLERQRFHIQLLEKAMPECVVDLEERPDDGVRQIRLDEVSAGHASRCVAHGIERRSANANLSLATRKKIRPIREIRDPNTRSLPRSGVMSRRAKAPDSTHPSAHPETASHAPTSPSAAPRRRRRPPPADSTPAAGDR